MGESARTQTDGPIVIWSPQKGPQTAFVTCPVFEVFFGGARGGGKSDAVLGEWAAHAQAHGKNASGLMVRRERTQLYDLIERSRQLYAPLGAKLTDNVWRFPNGARLRFAYLERDADADAYQGHNYTRVYVEEAGTFPRAEPILKLMATLRSGAGVPCGLRLTGNPGGPGHQWVKQRYIDPAPLGWQVIKQAFTSPFDGSLVERERIYIPSRVNDNAYLGAEYVANLSQAGSPELVKAWLEGDWDVIAGAYFPEFSTSKHVCKPFEIPKHWARIRAMDWGSAKPFAVYWGAVADGESHGIDRGTIVIYREWYGCQPDKANTGLKLTAEEVGAGIRKLEQGERLNDEVLDPAAFSNDGGPSIAERMDLGFRPADNARVARNGAMGGWDQVRARLKQNKLLIFSTCTALIRTLPALPHDPHRAEDIDTEAEDHAADALRYLCMSRPIIHDAPGKPMPKWPTEQSFNELVRRARAQRLENR